MTEDPSNLALPILMGSLRQRSAQGVLLLTQPEGPRALHWREGRLIRVDSEVSAERGATSEAAQEDLLVRALGEPLLQAAWNPLSAEGEVDGSRDLRRAIWGAFHRGDLRRHPEASLLGDLGATWRGGTHLLEALGDLPLTPAQAYAASRLGADALDLEAIASLTALPRGEAARLVAVLWALGHLIREEGVPFEPEAPPARETAPPARSRGGSGSSAETAASASERASDLWLEAQAYVKEGRTSEAIRALEEALRWRGEGPDAYEPWLLLGRLRLGNPAWSHRAMEALRVAARLNPRAADPWLLMGGIYRAKGLEVNAEGCFRRAQNLNPRVVIPPPDEDAKPSDQAVPRLRQALAKLQGLLKARQD